MYWKLIILALVCCLMVETNASNNCKLDANTKTRQFTNLEKFQGNTRSFGINDEGYLGSRVNFSDRIILMLPENAFISYTSDYVTSIDVSNKYITYIAEGAFTSLTCLHSLDLSNNAVSKLSNGTFSSLNNLRNLNVSKNRLSYISDKVFSGLNSLVNLNLSYNHISMINGTALSGTSMLEYLDLSHNFMQHINYLFGELSNLKVLNLDHNSLAVIPTNLFSKNALLEKLDLSGNQMVTLYLIANSFNPQTLQLFNLSNNCLPHLNISCFVDQFSNSNTTIDLNDNKFQCVDWEQYLRVFQSNNITVAAGRNFAAKRHINGTVCDNDIPFQGDEANLTADEKCSNEENSECKKSTVVDSNNSSNRVPFKYIVIALTVIASAFIMFLTVDYVLRIGVWQRLTARHQPFCPLPVALQNVVNDRPYAHLDPAW